MTLVDSPGIAGEFDACDERDELIRQTHLGPVNFSSPIRLHLSTEDAPAHISRSSRDYAHTIDRRTNPVSGWGQDEDRESRFASHAGMPPQNAWRACDGRKAHETREEDLSRGSGVDTALDADALDVCAISLQDHSQLETADSSTRAAKCPQEWVQFAYAREKDVKERTTGGQGSCGYHLQNARDMECRSMRYPLRAVPPTEDKFAPAQDEIELRGTQSLKLEGWCTKEKCMVRPHRLPHGGESATRRRFPATQERKCEHQKEDRQSAAMGFYLALIYPRSRIGETEENVRERGAARTVDQTALPRAQISQTGKEESCEYGGDQRPIEPSTGPGADTRYAREANVCVRKESAAEVEDIRDTQQSAACTSVRTARLVVQPERRCKGMSLGRKRNPEGKEGGIQMGSGTNERGGRVDRSDDGRAEKGV
ncbi:hypothetical protein FB451DRAFT_1185963 [Mycena latifolia]|nr:hypothetical protein FB451DRAFT_1185963 [Mycena latifolia]